MRLYWRRLFQAKQQRSKRKPGGGFCSRNHKTHRICKQSKQRGHSKDKMMRCCRVIAYKLMSLQSSVHILAFALDKMGKYRMSQIKASHHLKFTFIRISLAALLQIGCSGSAEYSWRPISKLLGKHQDR